MTCGTTSVILPPSPQQIMIASVSPLQHVLDAGDNFPDVNICRLGIIFSIPGKIGLNCHKTDLCLLGQGPEVCAKVFTVNIDSKRLNARHFAASPVVGIEGISNPEPAPPKPIASILMAIVPSGNPKGTPHISE